MKTLLLLLFCGSCYVAGAQEAVYVSKDTSTAILNKVEVEATFPGGQGAWAAFISSNIDSEVPGKKGASAGKYTVIVQFIVDRDGNVIDVKALTHFGYGMEEELMRVISKSPRWKPAMQNARTVKAYRRQPLTFVVEEEKKKKKRLF